MLLLRPLYAHSAFPQDALLPARETDRHRLAVVEARLLYSAAAPAPQRIEAAVAALDAALRAADGERLAVLVSEHAENTFPRLPLRSGEHVLVWFAQFRDEAARQRFRAALAASPTWRKAEALLTEGAPRASEALRLAPTARSRLPR